jgi:histone H3/H4
MKYLPISVMEKLLKDAGAARVSEGAKTELKKVLEKRAKSVSLKAVAFASHAKRATVKRKDIEISVEDL